jgi:mono/diheme cytochrome c family protein
MGVMAAPTKILKFLRLVGLLAILGGIGAAAFFFGGFFSVAADAPDPDIVNWALVRVREASIARHATDRPPGSLDDPVLVRAGARAYSQRGCINCHGGPGTEPAPFSDGLNPRPNLKKVVNDLLPQELFWVIKNGIKMTGMPSFGSVTPPLPDQEIWTMVAFLKKLSKVSDEDYKAWSAAPTGVN